MYRLACWLLLALPALVAACHEEGVGNLELTVDGALFPSQREAANIAGTEDPELRHLVLGSTSNDDEWFTESFFVPRDLHQTLVTPATLRVVGTATTVDAQPGSPSSDAVEWTYAADTDNAPEIHRAFMLHYQSPFMWDGVHVQRLDGTLVIERASEDELFGRIDLDVVGAVPPLDVDVERHAHVTGTFVARALP
jgi:hypothetical protein